MDEYDPSRGNVIGEWAGRPGLVRGRDGLDHETLEKNTVTLRDRDSTKQVRVKTSELKEKIEEFFEKS